MPLREISNNAASLPRGTKGTPSADKTWTRTTQKASTSCSYASVAKKNLTATDPVAPLAESNKKRAATLLRPFIQKLNQEVTQKHFPKKAFFDSIAKWDSFLTDDIQKWSMRPQFKQNDTSSICCLLCSKSIRGQLDDEILVQKHVKGSHHKKTFVLMENIKALKEKDPARFADLIKILTKPSNQPTSNCTSKQLLAYYHNVTIQALQSKKDLNGIVEHFLRRFLHDKLQRDDDVVEKKDNDLPQDKDASRVELKKNSTNDNCENVDAKTKMADESDEHLVVGNEENVFGVVIRSPSATQPDSRGRTIDTPYVGNAMLNHANSAKTPKTKTLSSEAPSSTRVNNPGHGVLESPASDISVQSEIGWMGTIAELDDSLLQSPREFKIHVDTALQKIVETDAEDDSSMMGMPKMVVTSLENWQDVDVQSFLYAEYESFCVGKQQHVTSTPEDKVNVKDSANIPDLSRALPSNEDVAAREETPVVPSSNRIEHDQNTARFLECIAELAFVKM